MGNKFFTMGLCATMAVSLSGCLDGGGDAGDGPGVGAAGFEAAYNAADGKAPTADMPTALNADYAGQFKAGVRSGAAIGVDENVEIVGDLNLGVQWTENQTNNPFTGSASNIVVTNVVSGTSETLSGSLNVDPDQANTITRTNVPGSTIAGISVPESNTGAFAVGFNGQLTGAEGAVDATVGITGFFRGPQGESMVGVVNGGFKEADSTNPALFDAAVGGVAYLDRQ